MHADTILEITGISKKFPGVLALDKVDFNLRRGEVHSIIGENGAGKSTLMKILIGMHKPSGGTMMFKGIEYSPESPKQALARGISMIHQEISLVPSMSVSENVWIGRENNFRKNGLISHRLMEAATIEILTKLGVNINPAIEVGMLSIAKMQLVEIARAVSYDSDVIIMDEPTSALTNTEVSTLYKIIDDLTKRGKSIIFISHKLDEIFSICDRVTVFRDGQFISVDDVSDITKEDLVRRMVGRELKNMYPKTEVAIGVPVLEVRNLTNRGVFNDISFEVHKGEILGFSGLMGAGRTEIMQAIFGIDKYDSGTIILNGKEIQIRNTRHAIKNKLAMVTEDRFRRGIIHSLSVKYNITLAYLKNIVDFGFINKRKENDSCKAMVKAMNVKAPSVDDEIALLSGGNQQKVIIGKWLLNDPDVLILDEPTRGIDVGAKSEIYKLIGSMAEDGKAVIIVSSELPEIMGICDRIIVIHEGKISGEFPREEFSQEKIMARAFGTN